MIISMFNVEMICLECKKKEELHPKYEEACEAERKAGMKGDKSFRGIGLPEDLR